MGYEIPNKRRFDCPGGKYCDPKTHREKSVCVPGEGSGGGGAPPPPPPPPGSGGSGGGGGGSPGGQLLSGSGPVGASGERKGNMVLGKVSTPSTTLGVDQIFDNRSDHCGDITRVPHLGLPLISGGILDLGWTRQGSGTTGAASFANGWIPGGFGGIFSFLPHWNEPSPSDANNSVVIGTTEGQCSYDPNGNCEGNLPLAGNFFTQSNTNYFSEYRQWEGTYFEWFGIQSSGTPMTGMVNRSYDCKGNQLLFSYVGPITTPTLDRITGDIGGGLVPYFAYMSPRPPYYSQLQFDHIYIYDSVTPANSRTVYFIYGQDGSQWTHLNTIVNPDGCTHQMFGTADSTYKLVSEIDGEGYITYFEYAYTSPGYPYLVTKTVEPTGRITYYNYRINSPSMMTNFASLGRQATYFAYQLSSAVDQLSVPTIEMDPLGNTTYWTYDPTLMRVSKRLEANQNLTYFEYLGSSFVNQYAVTRQVSAFNGASSYFGYSSGTYDMVLQVGPRWVPGSTIEVTYYQYDGSRSKVAEIDALGRATLFGRDSQGRMISQQDPRGYTTYWNYNQPISGQVTTGFLDSVVDFQGGIAYYGYNSFRDVVRLVSSRWTEPGGMAAFTTYYEYDQMDRRTKAVDPLLNVTYFDWTSRCDPLDTVDARGTETAWTYDGLRQLTQETVTDLTGSQLTQTKHGYDIYKNRVQTLDALGNTTYFIYDQIDRVAAVLDPLGELTYFGYDSVSNRTRILDARGNTTYFEFDLLSRHTALQDALGNRTLSFYDLADNRTQVLDARINTSYYFYDALDRLNVTRDALANATYFYFDQVGNRSVLTNARFNSTYYFYDGLSRRTSMRDAQGNFTYYAFDNASNLTQVTDARSNVARLFYDPLDRTSVTLDPLLDATYFGYDSVSNRTRVMDARMNTSYFFYDGLHRRTAWVDAQLDITYFGYDQTNNLTGVLDPRQNATYFFWDALQRRSAVRDAIGNVTYFGYDPVGNLAQVMDARTNSTYFTYDADNRRTSAIDALSNTTKSFYDAVSNRTAVLDPLLNATYFGYDAINRLTIVQDALGGVTYFEFDPVSNLTKVLDPDKHATQTQYDTLDRPSALRFPDAGSAYFFYDAVSNRTKVVDPRGNATYYAYDAVNRLSSLQDALGRTLSFQYDAVGNLSQSVDAEEGSAGYTYDKINRRTNIAYTAVGADVPASLGANPYYVYDPASNLVQMGDLWGLHLWAYDADNRPTQHQYPSKSVVYFRYDPVWNVTARIYPGTSGTAGAAYDAVNRQTQVQSPSGETAYFTYDATSNLTQRLLGNSTKMVATYDAAERISKWRYGAASGASLSYFDYTRDVKGLITKAVREANYTVYYTYDPNDRLASEIWAKTGSTPSEVYGYRYAYDLAGNRTKARINGANTYYFYDKANQLKVTGTNSKYASPTYYIYDKNGSVTNIVPNSGAATYFAYNTAGLVAQIKWADASASYFFYDGHLRRYAAVLNGTATYFLWEGPDLLQELNADGTTKEEHTNAMVPIPGIGQLVETNRPGQTQQKIFPIMDPRGSITKYIQSDGSTVFASREYDAFGTIIPNSATGTWPGRFGYQGEWWQEFFSANGSQRILISPTRLYDSTTGRFLQNEPLLLNRPLNQYLFSRQSPLHLVDPNGLQDKSNTASGGSSSCDPCRGMSAQDQEALRNWLLAGQDTAAIQRFLLEINPKSLFGRETVNAREFVDVGRMNPNATILGNDIRTQLVVLGQMQARGYVGGPYAFKGGPGYLDEWGFRHQTFCMSCHDPINPVAQARLGVAKDQTAWWKFAVETAPIVAPLGLSGLTRLASLGQGLGKCGTSLLVRAVTQSELEDLLASGVFRNPYGIEVKYFSTTAEGASWYAKQALRPEFGPFTLVETSIPTTQISPNMILVVDRGVPTIVVPSGQLPQLSPPLIMNQAPLPRIR